MWILQIFYKEFLSLRPLVFLGLAALIVALMVLHGSTLLNFLGTFQIGSPFLDSDFFFIYFTVAYTLAIAFGFWMTLWEFGRGTWLFLLHRPRSLTQILLAKLASGMIILMLTTGLPALAYAIYISRPGVIVLPFEWRFTLDFWKFWLTIPLCYMAAFDSGLRDARWYVSRLLPLACSAFAVTICNQFVYFSPWSFWFALFLFAWLFLSSILQEASTRDFS